MCEVELLAKLRERLPAGGSRVELGSGDDAAVTVPGGATATSVDAIVEGVHFRRGETELETIGRKALATALSDLAAMGAEAGESYVVLGAPADLTEDDLLALLDGMLDLAAASGIDIAGGDLTRAPALTLAVTVVGHAPSPGAFVSRAGAEPGDLIVLSGEIGGAAAGRLLLDDPGLGTAVSATTAEKLRARQLDPSPRLRSGRALADAGARAMIDLSDGLAGDAAHLAERSGMALRIDLGEVLSAPGAERVATVAGQDPWQLLAAGGEDYELLASIPPERLKQAARSVRADEGVPLTRIGEVAAGSGVEIRLPDGRLLEPEGFDQLA
jgi:thiamine-monophosphate kinase